MIVIDQHKRIHNASDGFSEIDVSNIGRWWLVNLIYKNGDEKTVGAYNTKPKAEQVATELLTAIESDTDYEMPERYEIPNLQIVKGRGGATSMKANHGRS